MLIIHGQTRVDPAVRERYLASARWSAEASRTEDGNVVYAYAADILDPDLVHTFEVWESDEAFDRHLVAPHHLARVDEITELEARSHVTELYQVSSARSFLAGGFERGPGTAPPAGSEGKSQQRSER